MSTVGGPRTVRDSSLILNLDIINNGSYREAITSNLWNYLASIMYSGIYNWSTWGQSTIANSGNALSITYVSGHMGAYNYFNEDISTPVVSGKTYTISFSAKTTGGSNTARGYLNDGYNLYTLYFTNTMSIYSITFTCLSPGATYLSIREMSAGNVVTITNFSLVEVDTTWTDLSGNGNNGTLINGPTYDYTDNSLVFDGINDYVSVVDNPSIDTPSTPFTYELYLKLPSSLTADTALTHKGSGGFVSWFGSNSFRTAKDGGGLYWCSESISTYLNKVIHITYGFDGVNTFLYFNGVMKFNNIAAPNSIVANASPLNIGYYSGGGLAYYTGKIYFIKIYNRALSATEVYQNYNALKNRRKFNATGGIVTIVNGYKIHTFTSNDTFTTNMPGNVEVLVVAGGGGTGYDVGGGGGGGGLIYKSKYLVTGSTYVTVGTGGTSSQALNVKGLNGSNSIFGNMVAIGGGGGGSWTSNGIGSDGGSGGGGGALNSAGGSGTTSQGYAGGASVAAYGSGAGGGAGGAGPVGIVNNNVPGGSGLTYSISGTLTMYSGGGFGNSDGGTLRPTGQNYAGTTIGYFGFGANGTGSPNASPYNGNSGVVIVRYQI